MAGDSTPGRRVSLANGGLRFTLAPDGSFTVENVREPNASERGGVSAAAAVNAGSASGRTGQPQQASEDRERRQRQTDVSPSSTQQPRKVVSSRGEGDNSARAGGRRKDGAITHKCPVRGCKSKHAKDKGFSRYGALVTHVLAYHGNSSLGKHFRDEKAKKKAKSKKRSARGKEQTREKKLKRKERGDEAENGPERVTKVRSTSDERAGGGGTAGRTSTGIASASFRTPRAAEAMPGARRHETARRAHNVDARRRVSGETVVLNPLLFATSPSSKASAQHGARAQGSVDDASVDSSDDSEDDFSSTSPSSSLTSDEELVASDEEDGHEMGEEGRDAEEENGWKVGGDGSDKDYDVPNTTNEQLQEMSTSSRRNETASGAAFDDDGLGRDSEEGDDEGELDDIAETVKSEDPWEIVAKEEPEDAVPMAEPGDVMEDCEWGHIHVNPSVNIGTGEAQAQGVYDESRGVENEAVEDVAPVISTNDTDKDCVEEAGEEKVRKQTLDEEKEDDGEDDDKVEENTDDKEDEDEDDEDEQDADAEEDWPCPTPLTPPSEPHPFASSAPPLPFPTSLHDSFTALVLHRTREGSSSSSGQQQPLNAHLRFRGASEYAAYHRTLVIEDCVSAACSSLGKPPRGSKFVSRWVVQKGYSGAETNSLAAAGSMTFLILLRDTSKGSAGMHAETVSNDDLVEVRSAPIGKPLRWDTARPKGSVFGVVKDVSPDGGRLGVQVLASSLVSAETLTQDAGAAVRLGVTLTTSRREFEAAHSAPPSLIAPLLTPLLTCEPFYTAWNEGGSSAITGKGSIPGTTQPAAALPLATGRAPSNLNVVHNAIARWVDAGQFNTAQANAIQRCISPGIVSKNGRGEGRGETVRPCAGFALIHGPPGTGKTKTLVGAVSALLLCTPKPRILVCCPSNAAIDELALRLAAGRLGSDGSQIGMKPGEILRVGPLDQVSPRAHNLALDALTDLRLADLAKRGRADGNTRGDAESRERSTLLVSAQVVAATTAAAGAAFLGNQRGLEFDAVIMDEAAQASEAAALVPLMHRGGCIKRVILVGDHRQLPATAHSLNPATRQAYATSLFERLENGAGPGRGHPLVSLNVQHRMHPSIAKFPAKHFYEDNLCNAPSVPSRSPFLHANVGEEGIGSDNDVEENAWAVSSRGYLVRLAPYVFMDWRGSETREGSQTAVSGKGSVSNPSEARVVAAVVAAARRHARPGASIAVITPYSSQRDELVRALGDDAPAVRVGTVDGFQGQEADIVVLSCTRTQNMGFLSDERRLNVALTRARQALLIVGSAELLRKKEGAWQALVDDADARGCLHAVLKAGKNHPDGRVIHLHHTLKPQQGQQQRIIEQMKLAALSSAATGTGGEGGRDSGSQTPCVKLGVDSDLKGNGRHEDEPAAKRTKASGSRLAAAVNNFKGETNKSQPARKFTPAVHERPGKDNSTSKPVPLKRIDPRVRKQQRLNEQRKREQQRVEEQEHRNKERELAERERKIEQREKELRRKEAAERERDKSRAYERERNNFRNYEWERDRSRTFENERDRIPPYEGEPRQWQQPLQHQQMYQNNGSRGGSPGFGSEPQGRKSWTQHGGNRGMQNGGKIRDVPYGYYGFPPNKNRRP